MASLHKEKQHGREVFRLSWYDNNDNRRIIRLGSIGKTTGEKICRHVTHLVDLAAAGLPLDKGGTEWLAGIGADLAKKLAGAGLIPERQTATLADFIDDYLESRQDLQKNSLRIFKTARDSLVEFFGADRNL